MATFADLYMGQLDHELGTNDSNTLFTTSRRKHAVNEALRDFADLTECYVKTSTITCSNGVGEYNLLSTVNVPSGDFVRLAQQPPEYQHTDVSSNVTYVTGDDFLRRDIVWLNAHEPGWRDSTGGTPTNYYLRPDGGALYVGLYPPPSISTGSSETAVLLLPYVARPSSMTDDTHTPYQSSAAIRTDLTPYHQALVHYAAHQLEKLRRDDASSDRQLQKYIGYVQRFMMALRIRGGTTIRTARGYFGRASGRQDIDAQDPRRWP